MAHPNDIHPGAFWEVTYIGESDAYVTATVRVLEPAGVDDFLVETEGGSELYIHKQCFKRDRTLKYAVPGCASCQEWIRTMGVVPPNKDCYCSDCGTREISVYAALEARKASEAEKEAKRIDCTFRVILMRTRTQGRRFVAVAHNYDEGVFVTSGPSSATYGAAREALDEIAETMNLRLRWFDGEWEHAGNGDDTIVPCTFDRSPSAKAG